MTAIVLKKRCSTFLEILFLTPLLPYPLTDLLAARIFHIPAVFISKALKDEAVVDYRKSLITKLMDTAGNA